VLFTITEALVGAGLVRFGLVDKNDSIARAVVMAIHLVNTSLLTAALTFAACRARPEATGPRPRRAALWLGTAIVGPDGRRRSAGRSRRSATPCSRPRPFDLVGTPRGGPRRGRPLPAAAARVPPVHRGRLGLYVLVVANALSAGRRRARRPGAGAAS
jgi:hypothetical protein